MNLRDLSGTDQSTDQSIQEEHLLFPGLADPEGQGGGVLLKHRHQDASPHDWLGLLGI